MAVSLAFLDSVVKTCSAIVFTQQKSVTQGSSETGGFRVTGKIQQGLCGFQSECSRMKTSPVSDLGLSFSCTVNQQGGTSAFLDLSFRINTRPPVESVCATATVDGRTFPAFLVTCGFLGLNYYYYYYSVKWVQQQNHRAVGVGQIKA